MLHEFVSRSPLLAFPLIALFLFVGVFLGAIVHLAVRGALAYEAIARLPLEEDPHE